MAKESEILKLPKAPLQEVIFEVRWELDIIPESNIPIDNNFRSGKDLMQTIVKNEFPIIKSKLPPKIEFPIELMTYQTLFQYWSAENKWPVLQIGPGIFTVNETETNYQWIQHYFPLIKKSLVWLKEAFNQDLKINFASLRYIDRISVKDYNFSDWINAVKNNLNFDFDNKFNTRGKLKQFSFNQVFDLSDGSELQITISNGKAANNDDILVWETAIIKKSFFDDNSIINWLEKSHNTTSQLFREICKDELFNSFK